MVKNVVYTKREKQFLILAGALNYIYIQICCDTLRTNKYRVLNVLDVVATRPRNRRRAKRGVL